MPHTIVPAELQHLRQIAPYLRETEEIKAFGWSPMKALYRAYRASLYSRVALVEGVPALVWGVSGSTFGGEGIVWMMTTPLVEQQPLAFVRGIRNEVVTMLRLWPRLRGTTAVNRSPRFLNMVGFVVDDTVVHLGVNKTPFRVFHAERDEIVDQRMMAEIIETLGARQ